MESMLSLLKENQKEIIAEALDTYPNGKYKRRNGGLELPLGYGKTRIGIVLGAMYNEGPLLFVCSKTLIANVVAELAKFPPDFKYMIFGKHSIKNFDTFTLPEEIKLVICSVDTLSIAYKTLDISQHVMHHEPLENRPIGVKLCYDNPKHPVLPPMAGHGVLYSTTWGAIVVDEIQTFTNITTDRARAIMAVFAKHRWGMSGTMFAEPKVERLLGFHVLLDLPGPRSIPDMAVVLKHYDGYQRYLISRKTNEEFVQPTYIEEIVQHNLSHNEARLFTVIRNVLNEISKKVQVYKENHDVENTRRFSAYLLALIEYLRQSLVCPVVPMASVFWDMADFSIRNDLSEILSNKVIESGLKEWLDDEETIFSTRYRAIMQKIEKHTSPQRDILTKLRAPSSNVLVFSCFRRTLQVFQHFLNERGYRTFTISADMSSIRRAEVIREFDESVGGILLLTYDIGAEGLNLQSANVAILMDMFWNSSKMQQAIGRVFRPGQKAIEVLVYLFVSDTALESKIIEKNSVKLNMVRQLATGSSTVKIPRMTVDDIVKFVNADFNKSAVQNLRANVLRDATITIE